MGPCEEIMIIVTLCSQIFPVGVNHAIHQVIIIMT